MAITLGVHALKGSDNGTTAVTPARSVTSGSCLVAFIVWDATITADATISDSASNTWVKVGSSLGPTTGDAGGYEERGVCYKCENCTGGGSFTVTATQSTNGFPTVTYQEFLGTGVTVEGSVSRNDTTPPYSSGTITPAANGAGLFGATGLNPPTNAGAISVASPFTLQESVASPDLYFPAGMASFVQTTAAAVEAEFSHSGGVNGDPSSGICITLVVSESSSSRTATLAVTTGAATVAAASALALKATLANTTGAATLSSAAATTIKGTLAVTTGTATLSSAAATTLRATAAITTASATLSSASAVAIKATLAGTLANATLSSASMFGDIEATLSVTTASATLSSAATTAIAGTVSVTTGNATLSSLGGATPIVATLAATAAAATMVAQAALAIKATLARTLDSATLSSGSDNPVVGSLARTLANATLLSAATTSIEATLSVTLSGATLDSTATLPDEQYFLCVIGFRVSAVGINQTLWSNLSGNTGVKIEVTSANVVAVSGGNGASINTVLGQAVSVDTDYVVTAEIDSGVMSVQLDNGTVLTAACELLDGPPDFAIGRDFGAFSGLLNGGIYEVIGTKTQQTDAKIDYIKRYVASRSGVVW